jgi:hypothetical protein
MNNKKESLKIQTLKKFRWLQRGSKFNKNEQKSSISNLRPLVTRVVCFLRSPWVAVVRVSYCILWFFRSRNFEIFWWFEWRQNWWITGTCRRATSCSLIRGSSILIIGQLLGRSRYTNRHQQCRDSKKKKNVSWKRNIEHCLSLSMNTFKWLLTFSLSIFFRY